MRNSIVLTFASVLLLVWFCLLPHNRQWFNQRIIGYWNDFLIQKNDLNTEHRKIKRWEESYATSKQIADFFSREQDIDSVLVLIPPPSYFTQRKLYYPVPEPAVFYYYTGLKTTWAKSSEASKANWLVTVDNGSLKFVHVSNRQMVLDSIDAFKKYPVNW